MPSRRFPLLVPLLLALCLAKASVSASPLLSSNDLVFVSVDHAPMGVCSTFGYGYKGPICGLGTSGGYPSFWNNGRGILIGLSGNSGLQLVPFLGSAASISSAASYFPDASVRRTLNPCTDEYSVDGDRLTFAHYSPAWCMADLNTATLTEKRRFFLPATWMVFTIRNTNSTPEDFYFGLPMPVTQRTFGQGSYQGFALGEAALAVQTGSCDVWSGTRLTAALDGMTNGGAFHVSVPAGQSRELVVVIAYSRTTVVDSRIGSTYYYTSLFPSIDSVVDAAFAGLGEAKFRCDQLATTINGAALNPFRHFMASHSLRSYMADTACLLDPQGGVHWWEMEGYFNYINTFDLTVDHAFYAACMHPWTLRNVLDGFSGALPGTGYHYETPLYSPAGVQVSTHGFSFHHDMGLWPTSGTGPAYSSNMGDEELQSWILSAGLYWSHTGDDAWLTNNVPLLQTCLNSMLLRDSTNSAPRDGITKNVNAGEITTYDNLDASLQKSAYSGRLAVRNWACYLALNAMFEQAGDAADAATCENMAGITAQTLVNRWNTYSTTLGYIPALLDGNVTAATTPMIEGLAYPAAMGLTNAIDRTGGPYAAMLQALSNHVAAVLVPSRCLPSGGWVMTSANIITWQSKIFICQYAAEAVLGITNNLVNGPVDQIHTSIQVQAGPYQGWVDATDGTGAYRFAGASHYPRAVTSALWWLNPTNTPPNPVATSAPEAPTISRALAGNGNVLVLWEGVPFASGYNLKRAMVSGGPYTSVTNGFAGASLVDSGLSNGTRYYYILTATNQFGESRPSLEVSATPVPSARTNISATLTSSGITVSWPSAYVGWILQTNTVGVGNPAAWGDVPGSDSQSQITLPASASSPAEFFRLRHP